MATRIHKLTLLFSQADKMLPSFQELYYDIWRFAVVLEKKTALPLGGWFPPAPTESESLAAKAFSKDGPTNECLELAEKYAEPRYADLPSGGVWNGKEGDYGASIKTRYNLNGLCEMEFRASESSGLRSYNQFADLLQDALQIWPGLTGEVGPSKYFMQKQVFPDRPGVGWMLYLPRRIEFEQVPEARMIRRVKDLNGTEGTIIISEIDGPFDADNPEHVRVANALEVRLADQDLLPRYVDL